MARLEAEIQPATQFGLLFSQLNGKEIERQSKLFGQDLVIGRETNADLVINDPYCSNIHSIIKIRNGRVMLVDKSRNGTKVNGKLSKKVELRSGDTIQFGHLDFVVTFIDQPLDYTDATEIADSEAVASQQISDDIDRALGQPVKETFVRPKDELLASEGSGDPTLIDPDEDDDIDVFDRDFTPQFSLIKSVFQGQASTAVKRHETELEVMECRGDIVLTSESLTKGRVHRVRQSFGKRKLVRSRGATGYTLFVTETDSGSLFINGKRISLEKARTSGMMKAVRGGLLAVEMSATDIATIDSEDKTFIFRHIEKRHIPGNWFNFKLNREMSRMIGISFLTHVLAIAVVALISARMDADLQKERLEEDRFAKVNLEDLKLKKPPPPKPTPVPTPQAVAKVTPKPQPKAKPKPRPKPKKKLAKVVPKAKKRPKIKVKPTKVASVAPKKKARKKPAGVPNVAKAGVLGALGGLSKKTKQPQLVSALTNLQGVRAKGGAQTYSIADLQGKVDTDDVIIQRIGDLNTKGAAGAGNRSFGVVASLGGKKGSSKGVGGVVVGSDPVTQPVIRGSLSRDQIMKVINEHISEIAYCYEKSLMDNASLAGKLVVEWTISGTGSVSQSKIASSSLRNGQVHSCVTRNIRSWVFPKPKGGVVDVKFPFVFNNASF